MTTRIIFMLALASLARSEFDYFEGYSDTQGVNTNFAQQCSKEICPMLPPAGLFSCQMLGYCVPVLPHAAGDYLLPKNMDFGNPNPNYHPTREECNACVITMSAVRNLTAAVPQGVQPDAWTAWHSYCKSLPTILRYLCLVAVHENQQVIFSIMVTTMSDEEMCSGLLFCPFSAAPPLRPLHLFGPEDRYFGSEMGEIKGFEAQESAEP